MVSRVSSEVEKLSEVGKLTASEETIYPKQAMTRFALITLFTLLCACIAVYAIWTVKVSQTRPDNLLTEFNKIDHSLKRSTDSLQNTVSFKKDAVHLPEVEVAIKANAITACIDSIKHELVLLTKGKETVSFSYPDKKSLLILKNNVKDYNLFIREKFPGKPGIKANDFVNTEDVPIGARTIPWEVYHFENTKVFAAVTELTLINMQVLKLKQKAIR